MKFVFDKKQVNVNILVKTTTYFIIKLCFSKLGFCSFEVSELTVTTPDAFDLDPAADDVAKHGAECTNSWISIGTSGTSDKYCGRKLNSISANTASSSILCKFYFFNVLMGVIRARNYSFCLFLQLRIFHSELDFSQRRHRTCQMPVVST
jgi:hypothetical protein